MAAHRGTMRAHTHTHPTRAQVSLLYQLGLRKQQLRKVLDSRIYSMQLGVPTLRRKLHFLRTAVGLGDADICRLLMKFPRILEYRTEKTIGSHLEFFRKHGVEHEDLAKVGARLRRCGSRGLVAAMSAIIIDS